MSEDEFSDEEVFDEISNNSILHDSIDESGRYKLVIRVFQKKNGFFRDLFV